MKIVLLAVNKTDHTLLLELINEYQNRLKHYVSFSFEIVSYIKKGKKMTEAQQKQLEGVELLKRVEKSDTLILLDEKGKSYSSINFSVFLQKKMNSGLKKLIFVIGGPYGFDTAVQQRANGKIALSAMTFSHQMVRLFFIEQLYRAYTILKNEPYHHQ